MDREEYWECSLRERQQRWANVVEMFCQRQSNQNIEPAIYAYAGGHDMVSCL